MGDRDLGSRLARVLARRMAQFVPVLIGVTLITFFMVRLLPGGPVQTLVGIRASPQAIATVNRQLGLSKPLPLQYLSYMSGLAHGNLGASIITGTSVSSIVGSHIGITIGLLAYAVTLALAIAVPFGVLAATYRDSWLDIAIRSTVVLTLGLPSFWIGIMLVLVFGLRLGWFPTGGDGTGVTGALTHLFLPALTPACTFIAVLVRSLRAATLDIREATFVDAARLKGVGTIGLYRRHILRLAAIPLVTLVGLNLSFLLGSTVAVENVFAINGIGQQLVSAILQRDFVVVQGIALVFGVLVLAINCGVDLVRAALDPRVSA